MHKTYSVNLKKKIAILSNLTCFCVKLLVISGFFHIKLIFGASNSTDNYGFEFDSDFCSDEDYNETCCHKNEFQCGNGECIPLERVCNSIRGVYATSDLSTPLDVPKIVDCIDRSDEFGCSRASCSGRKKDICPQGCLDLPGNISRCTCYKGYRLRRKLFSDLFCEDINECLIGGTTCSHSCQNLNGSFACTCKEGFKNIIEHHGETCKAIDRNILVLYNSDEWIMSYHVETKTKKYLIHAGKVDQIAYDPLTDIFYWANENQMARSYIPGSYDGNVTVAHAQTLKTQLFRDEIEKNSLSIDWVAGNMYWLSSDVLNETNSQIMTSKLDGRYVKTILEVIKAHSLVVDPEHGKMYWTTGGARPHISTAWLNGMFRSVLIRLHNQNPTVLAMDYQSNGRLFWLDALANSIYYVNRDGTRPNLVVKTWKAQSPLQMDIFENYLYWVTKDSNELVRINKFGHGSIEILLSNLSNQRSMTVYHKRKIDIKVRQNGLTCINQCSHICLHIPKGYSCSCPDGNKLVSLMGESICDNIQEKPALDPLFCNCNDIKNICGSSQKSCNCTVKCPNDGEVFDKNESDNVGIGGFKNAKIVILVLSVFIVAVCFALSFRKSTQNS